MEEGMEEGIPIFSLPWPANSDKISL